MKAVLTRRPWGKRLARFPRTFVAHYRITPSLALAFRLALLTLKF